jgi:hypothetical protein
MSDREPADDVIIDFVTGRPKPNVGAEQNRQNVERFLVETKGYAREDIDVDTPVVLEIDGQQYVSKVDLVVRVNGKRFIVIKCAPGALDSRQREIVAAARLLDEFQIPLAAASDGRDIIVWDTVSGRRIGQGTDFLPAKGIAETQFDRDALKPLSPEQRHRVQLVFRSYDSMNVNR